jgi:hypothetical protein
MSCLCHHFNDCAQVSDGEFATLAISGVGFFFIPLVCDACCA